MRRTHRRHSAQDISPLARFSSTSSSFVTLRDVRRGSGGISAELERAREGLVWGSGGRQSSRYRKALGTRFTKLDLRGPPLSQSRQPTSVIAAYGRLVGNAMALTAPSLPLPLAAARGLNSLPNFDLSCSICQCAG